MTQRGLKPSVVTYTTVLTARSAVGHWADALTLLGAMKAEEVEPSLVTYGAALSACASGEQWQSALELFSQICGKPNGAVYNAAITACARAGQWEHAAALVSRAGLERHGPDLLLYTSAISACEKASQWQQALVVLRQLPRPDVAAFGAAISACASGARWEQALQLLDEVDAAGLTVTLAAVNAGVAACEKGLQWEMALSLLGSLASRQLAADVVTYSSVMSACAPGGNWQVVLDMLAAMRMATLELDSIAHDASQRAFEAAEIQLRHRRLRLTSRPLVAAKSSLLQGIRLHFCIFQAEEQGLSGWTLEQGSLQNRWDVILDGLLKAVMMDGQWPRDVAAHAFVGADAVHITGAIQEQVMPIVGYKAGRAQYQPATPKAFEETLWRSCEEEGLQGIRWELGGAKESLEDAKEAQLANLDALLSEIKAAGTAIAFATKDARGSYGDLLRSSQASRGGEETLFLLLGGAHGFDGLDDVDGSHQEAILNRFRDHLGDSGVACLVLGSSLEDPPKLSLANVVSFLRVEDLQGHLRLVANMAKGR